MCMNLIGSGVVFHAPSFFKELDELEAKGLEGARQRILVSDRCQINFDLHAAVDGLEEVELGAEAIGTTKRGIGPSYSTKAARSGIRLAEAFDEEQFERKLRRLADGYKKRYGDLLKYDVEKEIAEWRVRSITRVYGKGTLVLTCCRNSDQSSPSTALTLSSSSATPSDPTRRSSSRVPTRSWQVYHSCYPWMIEAGIGDWLSSFQRPRLLE
jgi:hypothetical protein